MGSENWKWLQHAPKQNVNAQLNAKSSILLCCDLLVNIYLNFAPAQTSKLNWIEFWSIMFEQWGKQSADKLINQPDGAGTDIYVIALIRENNKSWEWDEKLELTSGRNMIGGSGGLHWRDVTVGNLIISGYVALLRFVRMRQSCAVTWWVEERYRTSSVAQRSSEGNKQNPLNRL